MNKEKQGRNSRKLAIIITVIVIVILAIAIAGAFFLYRDSHNDTINITSEDVQKHVPDVSKEEIESFMNQELTDEQIQKFQEYQEETYEPEIDEILEDDDPTDNKFTFIGTDGNTYEMEVNEEYANMTDEECQEEREQLMNQLQAIMNGEAHFGDDTNTENTNNSTGYIPNDEDPSKEYIDNGFDPSYDSPETPPDIPSDINAGVTSGEDLSNSEDSSGGGIYTGPEAVG